MSHAIELDMRDVRNKVTVVYGVPAPTRFEIAPETMLERLLAFFGVRRYEMRNMRPAEVAVDYDSIAKYGVRYMEIVLPETVTEDEAREIAQNAVRAYSSPTVRQVVAG